MWWEEGCSGGGRDVAVGGRDIAVGRERRSGEGGVAL